MSKCRPGATDKLLSLESAGVSLTDETSVEKNTRAESTTKRNVVISIPYEALRDNKEVQLAFQDLVVISTKE